MICLSAKLILGDHIITFGKAEFITVNCKLIIKRIILMTDSILRTKSKDFAKSTVLLCRKLKKRGTEAVLVNQLLRSGTSVGANIHEAQYAQGTKDFISKFEIALKECNESEYWLELLIETDSIDKTDYKTMQEKCIELRRMLVSSVKTLKEKNQERL